MTAPTTSPASALGLPGLGGPALLHDWHARISDYEDHARMCLVCRDVRPGLVRCFIGTALYRSEQAAHARYQAAQVALGVLYG